jgi:hypothetical protein
MCVAGGTLARPVRLALWPFRTEKQRSAAPLSKGAIKGIKGGSPLCRRIPPKENRPPCGDSAGPPGQEPRHHIHAPIHIPIHMHVFCRARHARGHARSERHTAPAVTLRPVALSDGKTARRCPPPPPDKGAFLYAPFRACDGLFRAVTLIHTINACVRRYKLAVTPLYSFMGGGGGHACLCAGPTGHRRTRVCTAAHTNKRRHTYIYICMHIRTCLRALKALQPPARNWRWPHRARSLRFAPRRPFTGR